MLSQIIAHVNLRQESRIESTLRFIAQRVLNIILNDMSRDTSFAEHTSVNSSLKPAHDILRRRVWSGIPQEAFAV